MPNRLKDAASPYLLQHADNPVDWYPWCGEAFERAAKEDKPVFLSIGYSSCHWCHVMARESFADEETAAVLNEHFISVKVDREERPDIDSVYMSFCQAFTGSGGWPMSVFMTPDQRPFYAGTYFPPRPRYGMPGFAGLLRTIADRWAHGREELLRTADEVLALLRRGQSVPAAPPAAETDPGASLPREACAQFVRTYDAEYGGFGAAPKFPSPHNLMFLLAYARFEQSPKARDMAVHTLEQMRRGGIFDHVGYGFSRYSTDREFLAPHFEKMLYDNALLTLAYTAAYAATGTPLFLDTAEKTADYVLRELADAGGAFCSAQDADSEGEEGKYYLFSYGELLSVLGEQTGRAFCDYYGVTEQGNFEGKNILNRLHADPAGSAFDAALPVLRAYRRARAALHLDDKILSAWNGLMIAALACLFRATGREKYLAAARRARDFIEANMMRDGRLFTSFRAGVLSGAGYLDDYAFYAAGLLELYAASGCADDLNRAQRVCAAALERFQDPAGGFCLSGADGERLVLRPKEVYDGALPSGNAVMAYNLVRLSQLTDEARWEQAAQRQLDWLAAAAAPYPAGHCMSMLALLVQRNPPPRVTVVLAPGEDRACAAARLPLYADTSVLDAPSEQYKLLNSRTTYYICRGRVCLPPSNTPEGL